jgi:hypothetical protein
MHALFNLRLRFSRTCLLVGLVLFSSVKAREAAAEVIVQNDSLPPSTVRVYSVPAGAQFAARLTAPSDGTIVGVQIFWGSTDGNAPPSQEAAISIYGPSGVEHPDVILPAALATISSPLLQDVGLNEFRFLDPTTNLIPLNVPVSAGEDFFVSLQLANASGFQSNVPGLRMDADGYVEGRNWGRAGGGPWLDWPAGVTGGGDFGIRAIIQPVPEPSSSALAALGVFALLLFGRRQWSRVVVA